MYSFNSKALHWHVTLLITIFLALANPWFGDRALADQDLIYLIDRSGSIDAADPPHCQQAAVNHAIGVSRLSGGKTRIAFIFFNGVEIEVIAGSDGLPAVGSMELVAQCQEALGKPCKGNTPLDGAFEEAIQILKQTPNRNTTIVVVSDGEPATRLLPDLYSEVAEAMTKERVSREKEGGRDAVEAYNAKLKDGQSLEYQALVEIQQPLLFQRCLSLARQISSFKSRVVSFAFAPGLEKLRAIHEAAGGTAADYVELTPGNTMKRLHEVQLFDGILAFPEIELSASDDFSVAHEFALGKELEAKSLVIVELKQVQNIESHSELSLEADGRKFSLQSNQSDESLLPSYDNKGRLATVAAITAPAQKGSFKFQSEEGDLKFPGASIYRYVIAPEGLQFVCHPADVSASEPSGFAINHRSTQPWLTGLQWSDQQTLPLANAELVFRNRELDQDFLVAANRDSQFENRFRIEPPPEFSIGTYDVSIEFQLKSGLRFSTRVEDHFHVVGVEEVVLIETVSGSVAIEQLDFGMVGDDCLEKVISLKLHSETPLDLNLEFQVVDLCDSTGTTVGQEWISPADPDIKLLQGDIAEVQLILSVPADVPASIVDGLMSSSLKILNSETQQPVIVKPLIEGSGSEESLKRVQFTLKRPVIEISAVYAGRNWITQLDDGNLQFQAFSNLDQPIERYAPLLISTTSKIDREVTIQLSKLRTVEGQSQDLIDLEPDESMIGPITVPAGETIEYLPRFVVRELPEVSDSAVAGMFIASSPGLQSSVVSVCAGMGTNWGPTIWWLFFTSAFCSFAFVCFAKRKFRNANRLCPTRRNQRFRPLKPVFGLLKYETKDNEVLATPLVPSLEIPDEDGDLTPFNNMQAFDSVDGLSIHRGKNFEVLIERLDPLGQPLFARIVKAKAYVRRRLLWRWLLRIAAAALLFDAVLWLSYSRLQSAANLIQYLLDFSRLT